LVAVFSEGVAVGDLVRIWEREAGSGGLCEASLSYVSFYGNVRTMAEPPTGVTSRAAMVD
jgi:hypothetical protein